MDATQKTRVEQVVIIGGILLLGAIWLQGPLKARMGSHPRRPVQPVQQVNMAKPLRTAVEESQEKLSQSLTPEAESRSAEDVAMSVPNYTAQGLRDPLKGLLPVATAKAEPLTTASKEPPKQVKVTPPPKLTVQGLVWGSPKPQAIIDGKLYTIGERVAGAKIVRIDRTGVTIEHEGASIVYPSSSSGARPRGGLSQQAQWR